MDIHSNSPALLPYQWVVPLSCQLLHWKPSGNQSHLPSSQQQFAHSASASISSRDLRQRFSLLRRNWHQGRQPAPQLRRRGTIADGDLHADTSTSEYGNADANGSGTDVRPVTDVDRRDEFDPGTDEHIVADCRAVLVCTIVVTDDRACADIDVRTDIGIADIGEVIHLAAVRDRAFLDLDEIPHFYFIRQLGAGPEPGKRSDLAVVARRRAFNVAVRVHDRAGPDVTVSHDIVGFDMDFVAQCHFALKNRVYIDKDILAANKLAANIHPRRIGKADTLIHQVFDEFPL